MHRNLALGTRPYQPGTAGQAQDLEVPQGFHARAGVLAQELQVKGMHFLKDILQIGPHQHGRVLAIIQKSKALLARRGVNRKGDLLGLAHAHFVPVLKIVLEGTHTLLRLLARQGAQKHQHKALLQQGKALDGSGKEGMARLDRLDHLGHYFGFLDHGLGGHDVRGGVNPLEECRVQKPTGFSEGAAPGSEGPCRGG